MAHPTDYASMADISKLRKSSQPKPILETHDQIIDDFLSNHPHWSLDSIVRYLLVTHRNIGITRVDISDRVKIYIDSGI